jgi:hypothetical protein
VRLALAGLATQLLAHHHIPVEHPSPSVPDPDQLTFLRQVPSCESASYPSLDGPDRPLEILDATEPRPDDIATEEGLDGHSRPHGRVTASLSLQTCSALLGAEGRDMDQADVFADRDVPGPSEQSVLLVPNVLTGQCRLQSSHLACRVKPDDHGGLDPTASIVVWRPSRGAFARGGRLGVAGWWRLDLTIKGASLLLAGPVGQIILVGFLSRRRRHHCFCTL